MTGRGNGHCGEKNSGLPTVGGKTRENGKLAHPHSIQALLQLFPKFHSKADIGKVEKNPTEPLETVSPLRTYGINFISPSLIISTFLFLKFLIASYHFLPPPLLPN